MSQTTSLSPVAPTRGTSANLRAVGLLLSSVILGAIGQLLLKLTVSDTGGLELSVQSLWALALNPVLWIALTIYAVSAGLWLLALMRADLSFAYPFLSLTLVAVLFVGSFLFDERISLTRIIGFVVIMSGLLIIAHDEKANAKSQRG